MKKKERKKERKRQEVLWPDTHAKIAMVNTHTKIALSESVKVDQLSSLVFPRIDIAVITRWDLVGEFVEFWEEKFNLGPPKCSPTAIFKFARNISRLIRIARNTGVALKGPYITAVKSLYAGECSRKSHASCGMIAHKQKGYDQFMRIFNNNTEYSRYENFDLTRMFNRQCFCDSNIPNSHG